MLLRLGSVLAISFLVASCSGARGPNTLLLLDPSSEEMNAAAPATYRVRFETSQGDFVIEATRAWGPLGADRFYNLARHGFYDGAYFFRVIPDFVVQFGIPGDTAINRIWSDERIPDDPPSQNNFRGFVTFAAAGPNSRTTQVFINLRDNSFLDMMGFTPFARVVEGMEVVDSLYSGYGEGAPMGNGPDPFRIEAEGNAYLERDFPEMAFIRQARIVR